MTLTADEVRARLAQLREHDLPTHGGRTLAYVYDSGLADVDAIAKEAVAAYAGTNGLDPSVFPSVATMERAVVGFAARVLAAPEGYAGTVTSGGTESCLLAVLAARDARPDVGRPQLVAPTTVHAAFHKAAHLFGLDLVLIDVDPSTFRADPDANPLLTPSGKIEIYSAALQELSDTWELAEGDKITAVPEYFPTWEGIEDPLRDTYPLQCIGHHYKARTHSTYGNVDWMKEAHHQMVWLNPIDARARGIDEGDEVYVYNDRGRLIAPARVTDRIMPGVVSVPQGAWYAPDSKGAKGVDKGGCVNTLTSQRPTPLAKGNAQHTILVEIEKA